MEKPERKLDSLMWRLLCKYEEELKLREPLDPGVAVANTDTYLEEGSIAIIESAKMTHQFNGQIQIKAKRQIPQNLNLSFNLNLQLPPGFNIQQLPEQAQQIMQQVIQGAQQALTQQAQQAVREALQQQAPIVGVEASFKGGMWRREA